MLLAAVDEKKELNARIVVDGPTNVVDKGDKRHIGAIVDGRVDQHRPWPFRLSGLAIGIHKMGVRTSRRCSYKQDQAPDLSKRILGSAPTEPAL